jgi:hypothetical protein
VVTVALGIALSLGATTPAATAKPHKDRPAAAAKAGKLTKAERHLAVAQRTALRRIDRKDTRLSRYADRITAAELADGALVLGNIAADQAALAELGTTVEAATTRAEVRALDAQVRKVHPSTYATVLSGLRLAAHFDEVVAENLVAITELTAAADAKELEGYDVSAVRTALAAAQAANDQVAPLTAAAVAKGVALTARSTHAEKAAFRADLAAAGDLLDTVEEQLQAAEDALALLTTLPVVTDPVVTEPVVTEPVV